MSMSDVSYTVLMAPTGSLVEAVGQGMYHGWRAAGTLEFVTCKTWDSKARAFVGYYQATDNYAASVFRYHISVFVAQNTFRKLTHDPRPRRMTMLEEITLVNTKVSIKLSRLPHLFINK